jgi:hypothetical protein
MISSGMVDSPGLDEKWNLERGIVFLIVLLDSEKQSMSPVEAGSPKTSFLTNSSEERPILFDFRTSLEQDAAL